MTTSMILSMDTFSAIRNHAETLVKSQLLPASVNTPEKAIAIITYGLELGIGAWTALTGINVIQGKPTISPALMLGLINRSGYLEDMQIEANDEHATVTMKRKGRTAHTEVFTLADANKMQLTGKDNYKKQPRVMLKWRAVSACARVVFPDVLNGLYTSEEIAPDSVTVDDDGIVTVLEMPRLSAATSPRNDATPTSGASTHETTERASNGHSGDFIENGTKDTAILKALTVVEKDGKNRLKFTTTDNRTVFAFTRSLFLERGWCDEMDWKDLGAVKLDANIPVGITYHLLTDDNGEIKGGYWEISSVSEVVFDDTKAAV